jgi:hypothetical protein
LLTGGLGSLGLLVAAWLLGRADGGACAREVVLLGRSGRPERLDGLAGLLSGSGIVTLARCDVSRREEAGSIVHACRQASVFAHIVLVYSATLWEW